MSYQEYKRQRQQKIHVFKDELTKYTNPSVKTVFRDMVMYSLLAVINNIEDQLDATITIY